MDAALSHTTYSRPRPISNSVGYGPSVTANSEPPKIEPTRLRVPRLNGSRTRIVVRSSDTYSTRPPVLRYAGCRLKPKRTTCALQAFGHLFSQLMSRGASQGLEHAGCAHAGTDAHGHHAVFLFAATQSVHQRCSADRPCGTQRMAERNRSAQRIDLGRVEAEVADHGQRLRSEGFV